jgi:hypothetical protein
MRKHINLFESVTNDSETNSIIEDTLDKYFDKQDHNIALDAIEMIYEAGDAGVSTRDFMQKFMGLHGQAISTSALANLMKDMMKYFSSFISKKDNTFYWTENMTDTPKDDDDDMMSSPTAQMAKMQIELTNHIIDEIKLRGTFTADEIVRSLEGFGIGHDMAKMFFHHTIESMLNKTVVKQGDHYVFQKEPAPASAGDHMARWRDMAANPDSLKQ